MVKLRKCNSASMNTGVGKCEPNFEEILGSILVPHGVKLPDNLTPETLEEMAHAERSKRIYGIAGYEDYAKNGGETQVGANGYGPEKKTGVSAWRDAFTMDQYHPALAAALSKCGNMKFDVYHYDNEQYLYGIDDGTEELAGIPCSVVYADGTPHKTSGANSTMTVNFAYKNAKQLYEDFDYVKIDFRPEDLALSLIPVKIAKVGSGFKIYEEKGKHDLTAEYGPLIAKSAEKVLEGNVSGVSYDAAQDLILGSGESLKLKAPSELYKEGIKGIEQV